MAVQTQTLSQIVSNMVAGIQGAATKLLDLSVGSVLRAFVDTVGLLTLWLQGIALGLAALTRLATSSGTDVDSFVNDFGYYRDPAQTASGAVTFARFTPSLQATIQAATQTGTDANGNPIWSGGSVVETADGSQEYQVIPDTTQSAYNAQQNAYIIVAGTASCTATVQALTAGSAGNAAAGMISVLGESIPGIDTVTNAASFTNGADAQSDAEVRIAFVLYLAKLAAGTPAAVNAAALSVQQGLTNSLTENQDYSGATDLGYFYEVIDDGSGATPSTTLSAVSNAIDLVRPIGSSYGVFAANKVSANIDMVLTLASGYVSATVIAAVNTALTAFIATLSQGGTLPYSRLSQLAYDASPGITNVTGITLNGGTSDLTSTKQQVIRPGTFNVTAP